jgi:hypothetical protein
VPAYSLTAASSPSRSWFCLSSSSSTPFSPFAFVFIVNLRSVVSSSCLRTQCPRSVDNSRIGCEVLHLAPGATLPPISPEVQLPRQLQTWLPDPAVIDDPAIWSLEHDLNIDGEGTPPKASDFVRRIAQSKARWLEGRVL